MGTAATLPLIRERGSERRWQEVLDLPGGGFAGREALGAQLAGEGEWRVGVTGARFVMGEAELLCRGVPRAWSRYEEAAADVPVSAGCLSRRVA